MRARACFFAVLLLAAAPSVAWGQGSHMALDAPAANSSVGTTLLLDGWAVDLGAASGPGVDVLHVYYQRVSLTSTGPLVFLAAAYAGRSRPDVGAVFGAQFTDSGFQAKATLQPGTYRLFPWMHSVVTDAFSLGPTSDITVTSPMQILPLGVSSSGYPSTGSAVAYDNLHERFLHVWSSADGLYGRLVALDGTAVGGAAFLGTGGCTPHTVFPTNDFTDVFVVACGETVVVVGHAANGPSIVRASSYPGETFDDVVFNSSSKQFLILSECRVPVLGCRITARHITPSGLGAESVIINPSGSRSTRARASYDGARGRYTVIYHEEDPQASAPGFGDDYVVRVAGSTLSPLSPLTPRIFLSCRQTSCPQPVSWADILWLYQGGSPAWSVILYTRGDGLFAFNFFDDDTLIDRGQIVTDLVNWSNPVVAYDYFFHRIVLTARNQTWDLGSAAAVRITFFDDRGNAVLSRPLPTASAAAPDGVVFSRGRQLATVSSVFGNAGLERFTQSDVIGYIDEPAAGPIPLPFVVRGWAIDTSAWLSPGITQVEVWAYPTAGGSPVLAGRLCQIAPHVYICDPRDRPDIAAAFGWQYRRSEFRITVNALPPGSYRLVARAWTYITPILSEYSDIGTIDVTVTPPVSRPAMSLDGPTNNSSPAQPFLAGGWAVDLGAPSGVGVDAVHVWAFPVGGGSPIFVAAGQGGGSRPDVGAVLGSRFTNSGYTFSISNLPPGVYDLGVFARSTVTGTFNQVRVVRITIN